MISFERHLISQKAHIKKALEQLNILAIDAILFVVDEAGCLIGSLTDGDVRRGFLRGLNFENSVDDFIQPNPRFVTKDNYSLEQIIILRSKNFKIIPVVDRDRKIVDIINFRLTKSYLPVDVVMIAGGKGERLRPLTESIPKPLLKVGDKPIMEHIIDGIASYGVQNFWISVRYLGEQIEQYFGDGSKKNIHASYIWESEPLGTIGSVTKIKTFKHPYVLVTNSDILTNLDYEDFFLTFIESNADFSVVTIPYEVNVPYAVLETSNGHVLSFKEKPTYTYYSNGGIYLMKREMLDYVPKDSFYNATDLMEVLIAKGHKIHSYPLRGYWLDIGKPEDYLKAQHEIKHIKF
jgi:dTDP-glucose pyrophosphorylase